MSEAASVADFGNTTPVKVKRKAPPHAWKPGQSGNPGGFPKQLVEVQALARAHTPEAIEALVRIVRDKKQPGAAVVAAANALLDRAWGKATQPVDLQGKLTLEALVQAAIAPPSDEPPTIDAEKA